MLGAKLAMEYGLACSTGGGTHHAFPSHGSGFCMLNDLAVTAKDMIDSKEVSKILIVDLDVHQVYCGSKINWFVFGATRLLRLLSKHCYLNVNCPNCVPREKTLCFHNNVSSFPGS